MESSILTNLNTMTNSTEKMEAAKSKERYGSGTIDKQAFLRLLMEQLKHQDPLKPMDNMQFVSQQAQFAQIEELQNLSKSINTANALTQSSTLIGKKVTAIDPNDAEKTVTGVVSSANISSNGAAIEMNGTMFPLDSVIKIENASP